MWTILFSERNPRTQHRTTEEGRVSSEQSASVTTVRPPTPLPPLPWTSQPRCLSTANSTKSSSSLKRKRPRLRRARSGERETIGQGAAPRALPAVAPPTAAAAAPIPVAGQGPRRKRKGRRRRGAPPMALRLRWLESRSSLAM